jgi:outer membrane protein
MTRVARLLPSQAKRARGRAWLVLGLCILGQSANAADLLAVYQRALQNDPQLREAEANRLAALEAKPQAVAALLPQLNGSAQIAKEHDEGYDNQAFTESFPQPNGTLQTGVFQTPFNGTTSTTNRVYRLDLKQNLFNWTNWVALKTADSQVAQAEADYQAAQQDLIERVSERYFNVLSAQDDLEAQQAALVSINRQLDQAESRYQIGLIAITDVEEVRASHDSTVAAVIDAKRTLASNQELLREITGEGFDFLARPIEPFNLPSPDPLGEDQWVSMALQQNLSLVSSRLAADIARENIGSAEGGHLPSLDLVASRFKTITDVTNDYSTGGFEGSTALNQSSRSIGLQLTFPLYSGGAVSSQVRKAVYLHRAAKERLERVARGTERDTRDAYLGVLSEISRVKALKRALESNTIALQATEAGYEAGTRTAVEVLESRRLWTQAQTNYSRSRYDYLINMIKLQQAAGILSEQSLGHVNTWLKDLPPAAAEAPTKP